MGLYILYMWCLLVGNFVIRKKSVQNRKMKLSYFKDYSDVESVPSHVLIYGRHVDNQFQAPMIFFISCLTYLAIPLDPRFGIYFAWGFVISRVVHSFIHLGSNNVLRRATAYALGWVCILAMWLEIIFSVTSL